MLPVMTSRQVRNGLLRQMDVFPAESYHTSVGKGDELRLVEVEREPFQVRTRRVTVQRVVDHGHYRIVHYLEGTGETGQATVYTAGPPDWGLVECKVVKKVAQQMQPHRERR